MPVQTQEAAEVLRLAQHHGLHLAIYENPYYQAGIEMSKTKVALIEDDMINIPHKTCGEPGPSNKSHEGLGPQLIHSGSIVSKGEPHGNTESHGENQHIETQTSQEFRCLCFCFCFIFMLIADGFPKFVGWTFVRHSAGFRDFAL